MAEDSSKDIPSTSDEDDCGGNDDKSEGRRRRFCIERKQQNTPSGSNIKRLKSEHTRPRTNFNADRTSHKRRKVPTYLIQPIASPKPKSTVIFINPKFVKKFLAKLASSTTTQATMIDEIDLKTSTKESLQAASTMAIIRLVTECIEDDSKRDEKLNKILVSRLIDTLR